MALFKVLSFGLIIEPSPSGTGSRAGGGFSASEVPTAAGSAKEARAWQELGTGQV